MPLRFAASKRKGARTPTNEVAFLPESVFRAHAGAAALYDAATVEVV